jgi:hypothetical protein
MKSSVVTHETFDYYWNNVRLFTEETSSYYWRDVRFILTKRLITTDKNSVVTDETLIITEIMFGYLLMNRSVITDETFGSY